MALHNYAMIASSAVEMLSSSLNSMDNAHRSLHMATGSSVAVDSANLIIFLLKKISNMIIF